MTIIFDKMKKLTKSSSHRIPRKEVASSDDPSVHEKEVATSSLLETTFGGASNAPEVAHSHLPETMDGKHVSISGPVTTHTTGGASTASPASQYATFHTPTSPTFADPIAASSIALANEKISEAHDLSAKVIQSATSPPTPSQPPQYSASTSFPLPSHSAQAPVRKNRFATLSFPTSALHILHLPHSLTNTIRDVILQTWPPGLTTQRLLPNGALALGLGKDPWTAKGKDAISMRRMTSGILKACRDAGWIVRTSTCTAKGPGDKDTVILAYDATHAEQTRRRQVPGELPTGNGEEWLSIAFTANEVLRLIDAPSDLIAALHHAFNTTGASKAMFSASSSTNPQVQSHGPNKDHPGVYEFRFKSLPWYPAALGPPGEEAMLSELILLMFLEELEANGFVLYASISAKVGSNAIAKTDTWYCYRETHRADQTNVRYPVVPEMASARW